MYVTLAADVLSGRESGQCGPRLPGAPAAQSVAPHLPEPTPATLFQNRQTLSSRGWLKFCASSSSLLILKILWRVVDAGGRSGHKVLQQLKRSFWSEENLLLALENRLASSGRRQNPVFSLFWHKKKLKLKLVTSQPYSAAASHHHAYPLIPCKSPPSTPQKTWWLSEATVSTWRKSLGPKWGSGSRRRGKKRPSDQGEMKTKLLFPCCIPGNCPNMMIYLLEALYSGFLHVWMFTPPLHNPPDQVLQLPRSLSRIHLLEALISGCSLGFFSLGFHSWIKLNNF